MSRTSAAILRAILLGTSCLSAVALLPARAQPNGGQVVLGTATITNPNPNSTIIDQKTGKAVINWNSFSIGAGGTVQFNQPNGQAITLNRVLGGEASSFYGKLLANGQVWIINQNGILFGKGASFNVGGILATTADISDTDFAKGDYKFSGGTGASVVNQGTIRTRNGGGVVLSGAGVSNQGLIEADAGTVILGGASAFTVDFVGDGLIKYAITQPAGKADNGSSGVSNSGTINAPGGRVVMTARAANNIQDAVVNNTGMISATSAKVQNGVVILDAGDGDVADSGTIDASGAARGQTGGTVAITGRNITVADGARIDVSGDAGGGTVRIGGDVRGQGTLPAAENTHVERATINADATRTGNGGSLVVWSNGLTDFSALFSAKGGTLFGNGGFLETSGHQLNVSFDAKVDLTAPKGKTGTWLLDPTDIVIEGTGPDPITGASISAATLVAALATADVQLVADHSITVNQDVIYTGARAAGLSLEAGTNITINHAISATNNALSMTIDANRNGAGGYIDIAAPITTHGGSLIIGGGATPENTAAVGILGHEVGVTIGGAISTAGGSITIHGTGYQGGGTTGNEYGVHLNAAIDAGGGSVSVTGIGGNSSGDSNYGIREDDIIVTTGGGNITLAGTGGGTGTDEQGFWTDQDITAGTGAISITGTASTLATGAGSHGLTLASGSTVSTVGAGTITLSGTAAGDGAGGDTYGLYINGGVVTVADGLLSASGTNNSTGTGSGNDGVYIAAGSLNSTGAAGVTVTGHGGGAGAGGSDYGVRLGVANAIQSTGGGAIAITGTAGDAGGSGDHNIGVYVAAAIAGHGEAISITGTGGVGASGFGVWQAADLSGFDSIALTGTGGLSLNGALDATGDVSLSATGDISGATAIVTSASLTLDATGDADLSNGANAFGTVTITNAANATLFDKGNVVVHGASVTGTLALTATGTITQSAAIGAGTLNVSSTTAAITLSHANNAFGTLIVGAATDATFFDKSNVEIDGASVTGTLALTAGTITQGGLPGDAISVGTLNVSTAGSITLGNTANAFAHLKVGGNGTGATIYDANGVEIDGAAVAGTLALTSGGAITQGGTAGDAIIVGTLSVSTPGAITLGNAANAFAHLKVGGNGTGATIFDVNGVEIDGASVSGTLALTSGGAITQGGTAGDAISVGTLSVSTSGAITLGNTANAFAHLKVGGNGTGATIYDANSVEIDGTAVGGTLALTSGGAITQGGTAGDAINVGTLNVSTSGAITLGNTANAFAHLKVGGNGTGATIYDASSVEIDGVTVSGILALTSGGAITQGGTAGDAISAGALNVSTPGVITLGNTANAFAHLTVGGNGTGATIFDANSVEIDGATVSGILALTGGGAITQGGTAGDAINVGTLNVSTSGAITLGNTANAFAHLKVGGNGTGATIYDASSVEIDGASVGGTLALTSGGAITQGGTAGDAISVGTLSVSTSGAITLGNAANAFAHLTVGGNGTGATIYDASSVEIDGASVGGTLALTSGGAITQGGTAGDAISVGTLNVSTSGSIVLGNTANAFAHLTVGGNGTGATIFDANGVEIDGAAVAGTLALTSSGAITQGGTAGDAISVGTLSVSTSGAITLGNTANAFAHLTVGGNGTGAAIYDANSVEINGAAVGGTLALTSGGAITQGGTAGDAINVVTLNVSTAGSITLGNTANAFAHLTVGGNGTGATIYDASSVEIDGVTVSGTLALTSGGAITQGGTAGDAISVGTLNVSTAGSITLGNTANAFAHLKVGGNGTGATIYDANSVEIEGASVAGTLALTSGGAITQGGTAGDAISVGTLSVSTSGAITLGNTANVFAHLTVGGNGTGATIFDANGVEINGAAVGGTLALTSGGAITQGGTAGDAISVTTLNISTAGSITLGNAANAFAHLKVGGNGTGATIFDANGVEIDGAAVGGTLALTSGGAITQGGTAGDVISVGTLSVSTPGAITLGNTANAFAHLKVGGNGAGATIYDANSVEIDGAAVGGTLALTSGGAITQGGTAGDAISVGTLRVSTPGAITLGNANNAFGFLTITNGTGATIADTGALEVDGVSLSGGLVLGSSGAITQGGGAGNAISAGTLNVSTSSGAITLDNSANSFGALTILTHGTDSAAVVDSAALSVASANVGGALTLNSGGTIAVAGAAVGGKLTLAAGGAITQSGAIHAVGLDASTTTGAITLTDTGNVFGTLTVLTHGSDDATLTDSVASTIAGATVGGKLTVSSGGAITQTAAIHAAALKVSSAGAVTLTDGTNTFGILTIDTATAASIHFAGGVQVNGAVVVGTLSLAGTGAVTQGGGGTDFINANTLNVSTTGAITLGHTSNTFGKLVIGNGTGATLYDAANVEIDGAAVTGTLALTSTGAITQSGTTGDKITANALILSAGGAITLDNSSNAFGHLTIAGGTGAAITDTGLEIDGVSVTGTLAVNSAGAITQGGAIGDAIHAGALNVSTSTGAITLANAGNSFATLTVHTLGTDDASLADAVALSVSGATVGGRLTLNTGAAISQSGAIHAASLDVSTSAGAITLNDAGNTFATLQVLTAGSDDATLRSTSGVTITGATVGGKLTLAAGGAIGQSGLIHASALDVSTVTGAIDLQDNGNVFGTLTALTQGSDDASFVDSTGVTVAGATVGGKLSLSAGGAIGQSGAIHAAALAVTSSGAITLNDTGNTFLKLTIGGGTTAALHVAGDVEVDGVTVTNALALTATGAITQGAVGSDAINTLALNLSAGGAITLLNNANTFATLSINGGTDASLFDGRAVEIDGVSVTGTLALEAGGAISQGTAAGDAIHANALDLSTTTGAITLANAANSFAGLTIQTLGIDGATLTDTAALNVAGATVGGTLTLRGDGAITQTGAIHAAALDLATSAGAITLGDAGNVFDTLTILTHGTDDATVRDSVAMNVASATVGGSLTLNTGGTLTIAGATAGGTLTLRSDGAITQSGAIHAASLDAATTLGGITLDDLNNSFGTLTVGTQGSNNATLTSTTGVTVAGANVSGLFKLAVGGAITQSGAIHAALLNVSTVAGAITLTNTGNAFGTLTVLTHGSDNATLTDSTALEVAGSNVGGKLTLSSGGALSQTGAIHAAALDVSAVGAITLTNHGNTFGTLHIGGAANATLYDAHDVEVDGASVTGTLALTDTGAITQGGTVADAISVHALNVSAGGAITLANTSNTFAVLTIGDGANASLYDGSNVEIDGVFLIGTLALNSAGAISQGSTAGDAITVNALNVTAGSGPITLANAGNIFHTLTVLAAGSNATLTDSTDVTIAGATVGGRLTLSAGAITQNGAIHAGILDLSASGAITLLDLGNTFDTLTIRSGTAASLYDAADVEVDGASVTGTLALTGTGDIDQGSLAGDAISAHALILSAGGAITLLNHGNLFGHLTITSGTGAALYDGADVEVDGVTVAGTLALTDTGAISQGSAVGDAINSSALDLSAGGSIALANAGNVFGTLTVQTPGGSATIKDSTGVTIAGATVGGTFMLSAGGAITQTGAIHAAALDVSTSTGSITLTNTGNAFGTLALLTHASDNATLVDSTGVTITGATVGGTLDLVSGGAVSVGGATVGQALKLAAAGAVSQSGAIHAAALDVTTGNGTIDLSNAGNTFNTLTLLTHGSDNATIVDSTGVSIASATVGGTLRLLAGGAVTQSGAIHADTLDVSTSTGAITLTNAGNAFNNLTLLTHNSDNATIVDSTGVSITGATVGGTLNLTSGGGVSVGGATVGQMLKLTAGGAVSQTGAIHAAALDVSTSSGAITLTNAANAFATLSLQTQGSDNATITDSTGVTIAGATVGGTFTLSAGGAVVQTGAIHADALDLSTLAGSITLTDSGNAFNTLTLLTHGSDSATIVDSTGVSIASATVGGTFSLATGGAITQTGAINTATLNLSTSAGSVTLTNGSNAFGTLGVLTPGSATITDSLGVTISGASVGGTFILAAGGPVTQTGAIDAPILNVSTVTGDITLTNAGNVFSTLTLLTHGSDNATLTDSTGVSIASATVGGTLRLAAGGAVSQTGAIRADALDLSTSAGSITLTDTGNAFNTLTLLTQGTDDATLTDSTGVTIAGAAVGGTLTLVTGGAVAQTGAINAHALNVSTSNGAVTLTHTGNTFDTLTLLTHGSDNATVMDANGVNVTAATVGGTLTLATGGAVTQTGAIHAAALDVSTSAGSIALTNAGNIFGTLALLTHGSDNATLVDSTGVSIAGATVGGTFSLAAGGAVIQSGAIHATALDVSTTSGSITLTNTGNAFGTLTLLTHGTDGATLTDSTAVSIAGATVGGTLSLATGGAVTQTGAILAAGLDVSTSIGAITLTNAGNVFNTLTLLTHGSDSATITDSTGVNVAGATVGGTLTLAAGGAVTQTGAIHAPVLNVSTSTGGITLTNAANVFGTLTLLTHGSDNATLTDSTGLTIAGATVGGTLSLATGGAVTQTGAINASALDVSTAAGAITLTNASNVFNTLTLLTHGSDSATITDSTGVNVAGATVGGTLTLAAGGAVTQTGAIHAPVLNVSTSTGGIALTNAANVFGTLTLLTHGSDNATLTDSTGLTIASATVGGTLSLATGGAVTQTGAIHSTALDVSTAAGAITLTNASNVFNTITLLTHGLDSATITDSTGVNVAGATVGGTLTLAAGGAVTQTGAIRVPILNVSTSTGGITLTNGANVFGTLTLLTHGSDNATLTDFTGLTIASATVGGTLSLATGGAVTQTGAILATGLNVSTATGAITLTNASNGFNTLTLLTHGLDSATITDSTGVTVAGANVGGTLTLATGGAVAQSGAIQASALDVSTSSGAITLNNAGNVFGTVHVLTHGSDNASLVDSTGVTIAGATVGGTLTLAAGGAVTQSGAINAAALDVSTSTGAIILADAGNVLGTLTLLTHGSDGATITDSTGVSVAGATVGGTLTLAAGGAITQTGAIRASVLDVSTSTGAITLTNSGNVFGTLTVLTHGSDNATLTDSTGTTIAGATVGGTLSLASGGAVSQTGAIHAAALDVSTSSGAITLTNAGNVFGTLTVLTHGADNASFADSTGVMIAGATVGGALNLMTGGAVSQTGAIRAASLNISTSSGAVTLTNAANAFSTLTVLTHGGDNVTLADSADLAVAAATVGGDLTLLSAGSIGVVTAVQSTAGAISLVAGWDGHTLTPSQFGNAGVFGNNGKGVTIGGASATGNSSLGSASGPTKIYGASLNVAAVHGYAQLGTHGHASGTILVNVTRNVSVTGGAGTGQFAQIGNGGLGTSGNNSGDITIAAGGDLMLTGGAGTEAYAQIGHGGAESNVGSSGYSNTGAIAISAVNLMLNAGAGNGSYVQIGHGGFKVGNNLRAGLGDNIGAITVNASGTVTLNGGDGADAYAQIGNGGDQVNTNASATAGGTEGGNVTVTALGAATDAVTLTGGTGANAYVTIGNGGYAANRGTAAKPAKFMMTGDVSVSDLRLVGGSGADNAYALIGNGDVTRTAIGNVGGNITIDAGSVTVIKGAAPHSLVGIGHYTGGGTSSGRTSGLPTDSPAGQGLLAEDVSGSKRSASKTTGIGPQTSGGGSGDSAPGSTAGSFAGVIAGDGSFAALSDSAAVFIADSLSGQRNSSVRLLMSGLLVQIVPTTGRGIYAVPPADQDFSSWGNDALWQ